MSAILAIDPGTTQSAYVTMGGAARYLLSFGIEDNADLLRMVRDTGKEQDLLLVIEQFASYGMAVGAESFETVYWSGRFAEAAHPLPVERITRLQVKTQLCHSAKANDANVRTRLIELYGGSGAIRKGGALYGVHKDIWSALAVAVAWSERTAEVVK